MYYVIIHFLQSTIGTWLSYNRIEHLNFQSGEFAVDDAFARWPYAEL